MTDKAKPGSKQTQVEREMSVVKQITRLMSTLTPGGRERVWSWLQTQRADEFDRIAEKQRGGVVIQGVQFPTQSNGIKLAPDAGE